MKLETLGIYIYTYICDNTSRFGELWRRTRIQYVRHVFASSFTSVSRDFALVLGLELGARQGLLEALVGSWVFVGLRASPIVLRPEISHLLVIRRDARTRLRLFHVNYVKFARVNVHVVRQCGLNAAK